MVGMLRGQLTKANTASWHLNIEVVVTEISTSVGGLHDHLLASNGGGCEREPRVLLACYLAVVHSLSRLTRSNRSTS